ncbi:hypothetical protein [Streptacidiphilus jiangxiensis]|uniref:Uncharacterized protein n=1 Tax=Streptacidiphilus jiangxiensis TaxID=235985 RepID=A0A1H7H0B0_STRJI|nr:hypothetical protein [Streptacidiphilus jiangxiensis]SEK43698.1 hypothetical protein SAMN05414137_10223 [Streptacidiphilus jiangxiensis]
MTPSELQQLLIERTPAIPGIADAAKRDDDSPYGLTVTLTDGGRVWWSITGASGPAPATATTADSGDIDATAVEVPDLTGTSVPVAHVEQALVATATGADDPSSGVVRADRYSLRPNPPAVRYGATLECRDGWKLFLSCYGTARPGRTKPDQPYQPLSHV